MNISADNLVGVIYDFTRVVCKDNLSLSALLLDNSFIVVYIINVGEGVLRLAKGLFKLLLS